MRGLGSRWWEHHIRLDHSVVSLAEATCLSVQGALGRLGLACSRRVIDVIVDLSQPFRLFELPFENQLRFSAVHADVSLEKLRLALRIV